MTSPKLTSPRGFAVLAAALALIGGSPKAGASTVLSDNITQTSSGTTDVSGSYYLSSEFTTGSSSSTLNSVVLLVAQLAAGAKAELDIYSDAGLQPGSSVATLTSPTSFSSSLTPATFTASGTVTLAANSSYWVVLKAISGDLLWSYTDSDTGTGAGFTENWSESTDAGLSWFTHDSEPNQLTVNVTPSAVPEPGSLALLGLGLAAVTGYRLRRRGRAA